MKFITLGLISLISSAALAQPTQITSVVNSSIIMKNDRSAMLSAQAEAAHLVEQTWQGTQVVVKRDLKTDIELTDIGHESLHFNNKDMRISGKVEAIIQHDTKGNIVMLEIPAQEMARIYKGYLSNLVALMKATTKREAPGIIDQGTAKISALKCEVMEENAYCDYQVSVTLGVTEVKR